MAKNKTSQSYSKEANYNQLIFGNKNYVWMCIGALLVLLGLLLMTGGSMPDANTWDEGIIYSFRRTALAPFIILLGFAVEIYAIFIQDRN